MSKKLLKTNIRQFLVINILLTIAKIVKCVRACVRACVVEDFPTQFSPLYLHTSALSKLTRHPVLLTIILNQIAINYKIQIIFVSRVYLLRV